MDKQEFALASHIYCSGVGGSGVSALARLLHLQGKTVIGSDAAENMFTHDLSALGVDIRVPQDPQAIPPDCDLFIYSDAVPANHPERQAATQRNISQLSYFEALGLFFDQYKIRIAVSGTHGKTTTTAMTALTLIEAGLDPTVVVGSKVTQLNSNARLGKSDIMVVEACEHQAHMLQLRPTHIIITNIEEDHLDYYHDLDHIVLTFQRYINSLGSEGVFIKNADDSESTEIGFDGKIVTFGIDEPADVRASHIHTQDAQQTFQVGGENFSLHIPGRFNVANACATIALARTLGVADSVIRKSLAKYVGTWRRFEIKGTYKQAIVVSDYAHHPTAISSTLKAAREFYPHRRLVVVFQPHQHNRTARLFTKFETAFEAADFVILTEIFDVLGRENLQDKAFSGEALAKAVEKHGKYTIFAPTLERARQQIDEFVEPNDVLLIMGAGNIYQLAENLTQRA